MLSREVEFERTAVLIVPLLISTSSPGSYRLLLASADENSVQIALKQAKGY